MNKHPYLKLLLHNPILNKYQLRIESAYLTESMGQTLTLPEVEQLPFLFSCFALSLDGKLCYPDNRSGFSIAKSNYRATRAEQEADWWFLMLARSISDALIIGSNSLNLEHGDYLPDINIPELSAIRDGRPLWTIVICRNLVNLDFKQILFRCFARYPDVFIQSAPLMSYINTESG